MDVATQTYDTINVRRESIFTPNIEQNIQLIINDITQLSENKSLEANNIMNQYYKEYNENGISIMQWKGNSKRRAAEDAVKRLACIGLKAPYWLHKRIRVM